MGLQQILGELPSGLTVTVSPEGVAKYVWELGPGSDVEATRTYNAAVRKDLYLDRGNYLVEESLDVLFKNQFTRELRKEFVEFAMYQNLTKRIINEVSAVYSESATRIIGSRNQNYQFFLNDLNFDRKMRMVNRWTNLLNECLLWFRVRARDRKLVAHVITPDQFYAIPHPLDPTELVAIVFSAKPISGRVLPTDPHWVVWSDAESFHLDERGRLISESYKEHNLGRMPGYLFHRDEVQEGIMNPDPGGDLYSAHLAVAILNVLMLKEQKSGTRQPYATGDISSTAMGQPMDSESLTIFQEGVSPGILDLGGSPTNYIEAIRMVIKSIAASYSIPESVFDLSYQATSGFEIELKRVGLRERRRDQILDYRPAEREVADIMSRVVSRDIPSKAFGTNGWAIDFGEVETPRDPDARIRYWQELRRMGLINTLDMVMEMNPEFSEKQAVALLQKNVAIETERVRMMRELQAMGASPETDASGMDGEERRERDLEPDNEGD